MKTLPRPFWPLVTGDEYLESIGQEALETNTCSAFQQSLSDKSLADAHRLGVKASGILLNCVKMPWSMQLLNLVPGKRGKPSEGSAIIDATGFPLRITSPQVALSRTQIADINKPKVRPICCTCFHAFLFQLCVPIYQYLKIAPSPTNFEMNLEARSISVLSTSWPYFDCGSKRMVEYSAQSNPEIRVTTETQHRFTEYSSTKVIVVMHSQPLQVEAVKYSI